MKKCLFFINCIVFCIISSTFYAKHKKRTLKPKNQEITSSTKKDSGQDVDSNRDIFKMQQLPSYNLSLSQLLRNMNSTKGSDYDAIFETIQQKTIDLDDDLTTTKNEATQEFNKKSEQAKAAAEKECESILTSTEKKIDAYATEAHKKSIQATKKALQDLVDTISITEQKALDAKKKARQQALDETIKKLEKQEPPQRQLQKPLSFDIVSLQPWKKAMAKTFDSDVDHIKNIVMCGEEEGKAQDFLHLFDDQRTWFLENLHEVENKADPLYCKILEKKNIFSTIVHAQKRVQDRLQERISRINPEKVPTPNRLSLLALYEVNGYIQDKIKGVECLCDPIRFSKKEIRMLAKKILRSLDPTYKAEPVIQEPTPEELERKKIIAKLEDQTNQTLDSQTIIMRHEEEIQHNAEEMKKLLTSMDLIKTELASAKIDVAKQKDLQREAEIRSGLVEEISERVTKEQKNALKGK